MEVTIQDLLEKVPAAFVPERAAGTDASIQLHVTGAEPGDYIVTIRDQTIDVAAGTAASPNLSLSADSQDILAVYSGRLDPMRAFMQGKLKVSGDSSLVMRLAGMFRMPQ